MNLRSFSLFFISLILVSVFLVNPVCASNDSTAKVGVGDYLYKIDGVTYIKNLNYSSGAFTLTFYSELSQPIVLSDPLAGLEDEGITRIPQRRMTIGQGKSTIVFNSEVVDGRSVVGVGTSRSSINIVKGESTDLFNDPNRDDVFVAGLSGAGSSMFMAFLIAFLRVKRKPKKPKRLL